MTGTAEGVQEVKDALKEALGGKVDILFLLCGSLEADFVGPVDEVKKAEETAGADDFCFSVGDKEVCKAPLTTTTTSTTTTAAPTTTTTAAPSTTTTAAATTTTAAATTTTAAVT